LRDKILPVIFLAVALAVLPGCVSPDQQLRSLVTQRLALAPEVAWNKFHSGQPVRDSAREAAILSKFHDPATRRFFADQISASRSIQEKLIASWRSGSKHPSHQPLDLTRDIRPAIDAIDRRQLAAIAHGATMPGRAEIENLSKKIPSKP
jgi:chorismate mutase-like protein